MSTKKHLIIGATSLIVGIIIGIMLAYLLSKQSLAIMPSAPTQVTNYVHNDANKQFVYEGCFSDMSFEGNSSPALPFSTHSRKTVQECFVVAQTAGARAFGLRNGSVDGKGECFYGTAEYVTRKRADNCNSVVDSIYRPLGSMEGMAIYKLQ